MLFGYILMQNES